MCKKSVCVSTMCGKELFRYVSEHMSVYVCERLFNDYVSLYMQRVYMNDCVSVSLIQL